MRFINRILMPSRILPGVCLCGVLVVASFSYVSVYAQTPMAETILQAERSDNAADSIALWKSVLFKLEKGEKPLNPALSKSYVKAAIINDYMDLYLANIEAGTLETTKEFITASYAGDTEGKAWALLEIINRLVMNKDVMSEEFSLGNAEAMIDEFDIVAGSVKSVQVKERLYYGVITILTRMEDQQPVLDASILTLTHSFIKKIDDGDLQRRCMKMFAKATTKVSGAYPLAYKELYEALGKDEKSSDVLIKIHKQAVKDDQFELAIAALQSIQDKDDRRKALFSYFTENFKNGDLSRARRIAEVSTNPAKGVDAWSLLGGRYLIDGYQKQSEEAYKIAESHAENIKKDSSRKKAKQLIVDRKKRDQKQAQKKNKKLEVSEEDQKLAEKADEVFSEKGIVKTVDLIRQIKNPIFRTKTFRKFAEKQTRLNDKYGVLDHEAGAKNGLYILDDTRGQKILTVSDIDIEKLESLVTVKNADDSEYLAVLEGQKSSIGTVISEDHLIKRLNISGDDLRTNIPLSRHAEITRSYYENNIFSEKFYSVLGNSGFIDMQGTTAPDVIVVKKGVIDLPELYDLLKAQGFDDYMKREGRVYTLYRPVVVQPGAAFVVSGQDVDEFRMSSKKGAFIITVGNLHIQDTKVVGWNDDQNEPAWATYKDKRKFRPYITGWGQSKMYIGNSEIVTLGYGNGKSYGLTMSAGPSNWFKFGNDPHEDRPTGIMADNSILNALYGYYSYEADDVVLTGNEYIDNIVYGIDPHDRSLRLAIGYNTAYETQEKHGIIISREVNDTIIFGNLSFDNAGTGIMLDRDSNGTIVYGNTAFNNKQEGITVFESDCEIIASNKIFNNKGSGFRFRNSYNIGLFYNDIVDNGQAGIAAYSATLKGDAVHAHRDFELDPYDELTTVTAVGNLVQSNASGLNIDVNMVGLFMKANQFVDQSPKVFRGTMFENDPGLLFQYDQDELGVSVNKSCPALVDPLYVQGCKFRNSGILRGDGMDRLTQRIEKSSCSQSTTKIKPSNYGKEEGQSDEHEN